MKSNDLKYEFFVGGPPEQVWWALISPEATKKIFAGCVIQSSFQIGDPIMYVGPGLTGDETIHVHGTLLEFQPNHVLSYSQKVGTAYNQGDLTLESRISFRLQPIGSCTRLTLVHDQWSETDPSYRNSEKAWWLILSNIKTLVETGNVLELGTDNWHTDLIL